MHDQMKSAVNAVIEELKKSGEMDQIFASHAESAETEAETEASTEA